MVASSLAVAYAAAVQYAAEKEMSQLDALVKSAKEGEEAGDALPRKVLADYLEENPQHLHDEATLQHLRAEPGQHEHGVHIWADPHAKKVGAEPHEGSDLSLGTLFQVNGWDDEQEPWTAADDVPSIDVDGADLAALCDDGVALWDNNDRRWRELTPGELPRVTSRLLNSRSAKRYKETSKLRDWMQRYWDVPQIEHETDVD